MAPPATDDDTDGGLTGPGDNPELPEGDSGVNLTRGAILSALGLTAGSVYAEAFMEGGIRGLVEFIIVDYLYRTFLRPAAVALWESGIATIDAGLVLFLGSDRAIDIAPGSSVGLFDVPFLVTSPLGAAIGLVFTSAVGGVASFNEFLASLVASQLGIAALPVTTFFWAVEIAGGLWLLWIGIQTVDIFAAGTIDSVLDVGRAMARPFVNLWRWMTG